MSSAPEGFTGPVQTVLGEPLRCLRAFATLHENTIFFDEDSRFLPQLYELFPVTQMGNCVPWTPGENVARCNRTNHGIPPLGMLRSRPRVTNIESDHSLANCSCGFYAYFDVERASDYATGSFCVYGVVEMYGECVVGSDGVRAAKARILGLAPAAPSTYTIGGTQSGLMWIDYSDRRHLSVLNHLSPRWAETPKFRNLDDLLDAFPTSGEDHPLRRPAEAA